MEMDRNNTRMDIPENITNINSEKTNHSYDFEEAFEFTGHGRFNNGVVLACGTSLMAVSMESLGAGYILQAAQCEFDLTQFGMSLLSSAIFIGIISSSLLWGYLSDTKGRRGTMVPGAFLATICSLLSSISPYGWMFILLRVLTGFFVSSWCACIYAYTGELNIKERRSQAIARVSFFIALGLILLPAIAWIILSAEWEFQIPFLGIKYSPWRLYIGICALPNLIFLLSLLQYPESPKYLYATDKVDEALVILKQIYATNTRKNMEEFPVKELKCLPSIIVDDESVCSSILKQIIPLFQMPLLPCLALAALNLFNIFALSNSFYLWFPAMLNNLQSRASGEPATVCEIMADGFNTAITENTDSEMNSTMISGETCQSHTPVLIFQIGLVMGVIFCTCYAIIGTIINIIGKKVILAFLLGMPAFCTLGLYWAANDYLIIILLVLLMCSGSGGSVITAVSVDLFPTKLRGMAMCISLMCGRLGAVIGSNVAGIMLMNSCSNTFIVFGVEGLICFATILLWPKASTIKEKFAKKGIVFS